MVADAEGVRTSAAQSGQEKTENGPQFTTENEAVAVAGNPEEAPGTPVSGNLERKEKKSHKKKPPNIIQSKGKFSLSTLLSYLL